MPKKIKIKNNDIIIDFPMSEGFLTYRDNGEVTMLSILLFIVEKIILS
ncbi:hypothetical protein SLITO_v1c06770 [Spiroplasma litorale]|uniref:Uncharacterized protein n=1 Tax=Spiroplasma litorale TaxID=216942 RepID=A0A0K1W1W9_9MOLU|nr:hypothetical protein [Spiroplasma litorale]AKX34304.1 hypothetical protein SLITO_v1c06770 [Spiroplasma litorale]